MGTMWTFDLNQYAGPKYQRVVAAIEQAIEQGELAYNSKLPPQRQLADAVGVTIGTITRAYSLAQQRGLVEPRIGDGTYVCSLNQLNHQDAEVDLDTYGPLDLATSQAPLVDQSKQMSDILSQMAKEPVLLNELLSYHSEPLARHQTVFHHWLNAKGITQHSEQIVFCHGAQQGIFCIINALASAGDSILHEQACYPGVKRAADSLGVASYGIPLTHDGLDLDKLEQLIIQHSPKLLYLTPNNQNPTCISYSLAQRQQILMLAQQYQVYIIEDDVNFCLPHEYSSSLWQQAGNDTLKAPSQAEQIIYLSSLSKSFAGGLRLGFMLVPTPLLASIKQALHSECWMVSPLNTEIACRLLQRKAIAGGRDQVIEQRQDQAKTMIQAFGLTQRWRGLNGWIELPHTINGYHLVTQLASCGVLVRHASDFGSQDNAIRISLGAIGKDKLFSQALETIAKTLKTQSQAAFSVI